MDGAWLVRARWRLRGAWMWPAFVALTVADGLVGSSLPPTGDSWNGVGAALLGGFFNLIGIILLSVPLGMLLRRMRRDLPRVVARDYAGTLVVLSVTAVLLIAGLVHRPQVLVHRQAMADAIARAQAWIGDRAPAEFRRNLRFVSTFTIESGRMYRTCVPGAQDARTFCVIVDTQLPFARSVRFDGYEPNAVFGAGAH
ncbi:MAG: hypothetical protein M3Z06_04625 [Actinomycetota bacterium]|nr:hypothetical protein [Actinomycetota bacterium]